jgi:hypothetical protein
MNIYWLALFRQLATFAAIIATIVYGMKSGMAAGEIVFIVLALAGTLAAQLPAVEKKKTGMTIYPEAYPKGLSIAPSPTLAKLMAELQSQSIPPVAIDAPPKEKP